MFYDFLKFRKRTKFGKNIVNKINEKIIQIIYSNFKDNKNILEIGPGTGTFLKLLSQYNYNYSAIEPNKQLSDACKKLNTKAHIYNMIIPPIKLKSQTFDLVYMSHVLEHFSGYKEILLMLNEIYRILKKDGHFVLFFPDYLFFKEDFFDIDYSHEYITTLNRIQLLFNDANFQITHTIPFNGQFTGFSRFCLLPFFHLNKFIFGIFYSLLHKEIFLKAKITFGKNILILAKKV